MEIHSSFSSDSDDDSLELFSSGSDDDSLDGSLDLSQGGAQGSGSLDLSGGGGQAWLRVGDKHDYYNVIIQNIFRI